VYVCVEGKNPWQRKKVLTENSPEPQAISAPALLSGGFCTLFSPHVAYDCTPMIIRERLVCVLRGAALIPFPFCADEFPGSVQCGPLNKSLSPLPREIEEGRYVFLFRQGASTVLVPLLSVPCSASVVVLMDILLPNALNGVNYRRRTISGRNFEDNSNSNIF